MRLEFDDFWNTPCVKLVAFAGRGPSAYSKKK
jgi:hypothetical protein